MIKPYIIKSKLKVYGESEDNDMFVDFYFMLEAVNAFYMADISLINIVIGGQIYELEYNANLYKTIKAYFEPISLN